MECLHAERRKLLGDVYKCIMEGDLPSMYYEKLISYFPFRIDEINALFTKQNLSLCEKLHILDKIAEQEGVTFSSIPTDNYDDVE